MLAPPLKIGLYKILRLIGPKNMWPKQTVSKYIWPLKIGANRMRATMVANIKVSNISGQKNVSQNVLAFT